MKSGQSSQGGGRDPISVWIKREALSSREVLGRGITSLSMYAQARDGGSGYYTLCADQCIQCKSFRVIAAKHGRTSTRDRLTNARYQCLQG